MLLPVAETNKRKRKALWWGDGAKPHVPKMLRCLLLEMFGLKLDSFFLCIENSIKSSAKAMLYIGLTEERG